MARAAARRCVSAWAWAWGLFALASCWPTNPEPRTGGSSPANRFHDKGAWEAAMLSLLAANASQVVAHNLQWNPAFGGGGIWKERHVRPLASSNKPPS